MEQRKQAVVMLVLTSSTRYLHTDAEIQSFLDKIFNFLLYFHEKTVAIIVKQRTIYAQYVSFKIRQMNVGIQSFYSSYF